MLQPVKAMADQRIVILGTIVLLQAEDKDAIETLIVERKRIV